MCSSYGCYNSLVIFNDINSNNDYFIYRGKRYRIMLWFFFCYIIRKKEIVQTNKISKRFLCVYPDTSVEIYALIEPRLMNARLVERTVRH